MNITSRQEAILLSLRDYYVLSTQLIHKLLFGKKALSSAQSLLFRLYTDGYVLRKYIPRDDPKSGKGYYVYGLSNNGRNYLSEQGRDIDKRFRPTDFDDLTRSTLLHTLDINAFLINLQILTQSTSSIRLARSIHEHQLKRTPSVVSLDRGRTARVIPDAFVDLHIRGADGGVYQASYLVEVDRQTRERRSFQEKIEKLLALIDQAYEHDFGEPVNAVTIAFIATGGEAHATRLCSWIEQELLRLQKADPDHAALFSITPFAVNEDRPEDLFLSQRMLHPFDTRRAPLIDLEGSNE